MSRLDEIGADNTPLNHSDVATLIQNELSANYNLVSDGTVGGNFDADPSENQTFLVKFAKMASPTTTTPTTTPSTTSDKQRAEVVFLDENGKQLNAKLITGESDSSVDHGQLTALIQQTISDGYNLKSDGTVGATFDHDSDVDQTFEIVFTQIVDTGTNTPTTTNPGDDTPSNNNPGTPAQNNETTPDTPVTPNSTPTTEVTTPNTTVPETENGTTTDTPENETVDTPDTPTDDNQENNGVVTTSQTTTNDTSNQTESSINANLSTGLDQATANSKMANKDQALPQTNEDLTNWVSLLGLLTLGMVGIGIEKRRKKISESYQ